MRFDVNRVRVDKPGEPDALTPAQQGEVERAAARPRREITVYECPDCGERILGEQRCDTCRTFARRIGIGGPCPKCDQPVAITDLLDQAVISTTTTTT